MENITGKGVMAYQRTNTLIAYQRAGNERRTDMRIVTNDSKNPLPELLFKIWLAGTAGYAIGTWLDYENRNKWAACGVMGGALLVGLQSLT